MRIVHLVDSFSALSETFIYDYITELQCNGVDNQVVTFGRHNIEERPFKDIHLITLPSRWHPERVLGKIKRRLHLIEGSEAYQEMRQRKLSPLIERLNPDVIHAHFGPMGVLVAPITKHFKIPLITTFYGYDASSLPKNVTWRNRYKELFQVMASATVLSSEMHRCLIDLGAPTEKVKVVHLGKRLSDYPYRKPNAPLRKWLSVGRLVEKKGHADCIKAFEKAWQDKGGHLTIVGEGALLPTLKDYVEQNGLVDRVTLMGGCPHHEVKQLMEKADAFILCSKVADSGDSEGTPTVLIEAQCMGLPCISTIHSGIPEMIPEENHWLLAEEGDIDGIAERINKLRACSQERLEVISQVGRQKVEAEFDLTEESMKLIEVYSALQVC